MSSVNKVTLEGCLGEAPSCRLTAVGSTMCTLYVATSESWRDKHSGDIKERTEWHRVVVYNQRLVPIVEKSLNKGSRVRIEGKLQTRRWKDAKGQDRYITEIIVGAYGGTLIPLGDDD